MRMITAVRCPKCKEKGAKRQGLSEGLSTWKCSACSHEFSIQILKLKKQG